MRFFKNQEAMELTSGIGIFSFYIYALNKVKIHGWVAKFKLNFEACKKIISVKIKKKYEI